jgi:ACR3 family arsenite efflux pump ArsB
MEETRHAPQAKPDLTREYAKLAGVFVGIFFATWIFVMAVPQAFGRSGEVFMGFFFLVFGAFKIMQWKEFSTIFSDYDLVAKRVPLYAKAYPAIEVGLACLFLANLWGLAANLITLAVTSVGAIGIWQNLQARKGMQCACLGSVIKLPLSKVSLAEDVLMAAMALVGIWQRLT